MKRILLLVATLVVSGCVYDPYAGGYYPAAAYAAPAYVPPMAYAPPTVVVVSPVYAPPVYGYGGPSVVIGGDGDGDAAGSGIVVGAVAGTVVAGVTDRTAIVWRAPRFRWITFRHALTESRAEAVRSDYEAASADRQVTVFSDV